MKKQEEPKRFMIVTMLTATEILSIKKWLKANGYTIGGYVASHLREVSRDTGTAR